MDEPERNGAATSSLAAITARLRIEPLCAAHAPLLFPALADPRIYAYVPETAHPSVASLARRHACLEAGAPAESNEVWLNWALRRTDTREYVGTLQSTVTPGVRAYIGYVLAPPAWGQGFATEACNWLVTELRTRFDIGEVLATVDVRNRRSIRVLERLGFGCAGVETAELHGESTTDYRYRLVCRAAG